MQNLVKAVSAFSVLYCLYCVHVLRNLDGFMRFVLFASPLVSATMHSNSVQDVVVSVLSYFLIVACVFMAMLCVWMIQEYRRQNKEDEHG